MKIKKVKSILFVCTGKDCKKNGAGRLRKKLKKEMDRNKMNAGVRIAKCKCLDQCNKAPVIYYCKNILQEIQVEDAGAVIDFVKKTDCYSKL